MCRAASRDIEGAVLVHRKEAVPGFAGHVGEAALIHHEAGIGDGDVDFLRENADTEPVELRLCPVIGFLAPSPDHEIAPSLRDTACKSEADSGVPASNQHDFTAQVPRQTRHISPIRFQQRLLYWLRMPL
jgi:hypothetical protein